jgi:hypothetical protein
MQFQSINIDVIIQGVVSVGYCSNLYRAGQALTHNLL